MKKLLLLLTACATICAYVSCGEKEESSAVDVSAVTTAPVEISAEESSVPEIVTQAYDESVDKTAFIGKWECTKFVKDGEEYTNVNGIPQYALFQYELLEDGNANLSDSLMAVIDHEVYYSWGTVSDSEIEIASDKGNTNFKLENGQLVSIENGEEIYLDKVDEFQVFDFEAYYSGMLGGYSLVPVETDAAGNVVATGEAITVAAN